MKVCRAQKSLLSKRRLFGRNMMVVAFSDRLLPLATNGAGLPTLKEAHVVFGMNWQWCYVDRILVTSLPWPKGRIIPAYAEIGRWWKSRHASTAYMGRLSF